MTIWGLAIRKEILILSPKVIRNALDSYVRVNAISVDSEQLYAADNNGALSIWKKTMLEHPITIPGDPSLQIETLHSDNDYLYCGGITGNTIIRVHNRDMEIIKKLEGHIGTIFDMASDDQVLASGSGDATVNLWIKTDWTLLESITAQVYFVLCVAIDTDFIYAGGIDNCINIFNRETYAQETSLHGHNANILALATDQEYVYSGSGELWWGGPGSPRPRVFESAIRVWDKKDWSCKEVLQGHRDNIGEICVDTNYIYSASDDGTVRIYAKEDWSYHALIDPGVGSINGLDHDDQNVYFGCADGSIRYIPKGQLID